MTGSDAAMNHLSRKTLCIAGKTPDTVFHDSDEAFREEQRKLYKDDEAVLIEKLIELKSDLTQISKDNFWSHISERLADILGAQMTFFSKRMLVDEQDRAVEMPPIGEPGACLMASALYWNDGRGTSNTLKKFKYHAYGCPCGYMRHDKVLVIPNGCDKFTPANPNELPISLDAYIGIPLFADGKCFAHFGAIWTEEGNAQRKFSWATIELALHTLEDVVLEKLLEGTQFREKDKSEWETSRTIIPHSAITAAQSLKPYARSLSHELRTPMQGVVGMLDVMYATVQEAYENQDNPEVRRIFESLKEHIEVVQDSSRRAVEAADNVVHAYDMDMSIPEAPPSVIALADDAPPPAGRPSILVAGSNLPIQRPNKRRRGDEPSTSDGPNKIPATAAERTKRAESGDELKQNVAEASDATVHAQDPEKATTVARGNSPPKFDERTIAPGLRHTQIRSVLQYVINEGLKVGGRPEEAHTRETDLGESIVVRMATSTGEIKTKTIEWSVDPQVPTTIFVDEQDLSKLVQRVFLNAIKFTEQGQVAITARMSSLSRHIVIKISDSGPGIPKAFLPKLFTAFSQEDPSLTRQSEGLGLGLLVAKGLARKLGGDLMCARTETEGPRHGSDFEIRIPMSPMDHISRPPSPFGSPSSNPARPGTRGDDALALKDCEIKHALPTPELEPRLERKGSADSAASLKPRGWGSMRKPSLPHSLPQTPRSEEYGFRIPASVPSPSPGKTSEPPKRPPMLPRKSSASINGIDRNLASKYPLSFLVVEDNKINRKLLVNMLGKFGYKEIYEAYNGVEAVRIMDEKRHVDVILMDLWMPFMDGYEATEKILQMDFSERAAMDGKSAVPTVLAVTADVTNEAVEHAGRVGITGFMSKPFKLGDLQYLIVEYCSKLSTNGAGA